MPVFSRVRLSILFSRPATEVAGEMPFGLKLVMPVLTSPGCKIATAMPLGLRSWESDLPAMETAAFDMR